MPPNRDGQLPLEALRDLIGICRGVYLAWKAQGMGPIELDELASIGRELRAALALAKKTEVNTVGHRAAWSRAEAATQRLGHLIGALEPLKPTIAAATRRLNGHSGSASGEREAKKLHSRMRG